MEREFVFGKDTCFRLWIEAKQDYDYFVVTKGFIVVRSYRYITDYRVIVVIAKRGLKVRKLKWVTKKTDVLPINDCKDKKFFFVDQYELAIDDSVKEFLWSGMDDEISKDNVFDKVTNVLKTVRYMKFEDKHKNYDKKEHTIVTTDN